MKRPTTLNGIMPPLGDDARFKGLIGKTLRSCINKEKKRK